jgi:hypothetical protein
MPQTIFKCNREMTISMKIFRSPAKAPEMQGF